MVGACLILHETIGQLVVGPAVKGQGVQVAAFLLGAQRPPVRQAAVLRARCLPPVPACPTVPHQAVSNSITGMVLLEGLL
jgi:hypothetical protein